MSLLMALIAPIRPKLVQYTVDNYIVHFDAAGLKNMALLLLLLLLVESTMRYGFNYLTAWLGQSVIRDLRIRVFKHLIFSRLKYFDTTPIGTATTRTISDIEAVNDTFSEGLITIIADVLTIFLVLGFMFYTDWKITLASIAFLPFLLWITRWFQEGVKRSFQDERTQIGRMNAFLQEHLTGMRIIQLFNVEKKEFEKFQSINEELKQANIRGIWYYSLFFPAVEILMAGSVGLMVWMASHEILHHQVQVGVIMAFILYISMLFRPLRFIADKVNTIQRGLVACERVFKLLDKDERISDIGTFSPQKVLGKIEFKDVWFAYNKEHYVLKNVSFELPAGETLAVVGHTGSGKTTTISLLGRFYEINKGEILLDGVNIRDYKLSVLRSQMSIVLQDVFLFAGSVYENITLRNENISMEAVVNAAKMIGAHQFISQLPNGYNYEVMERGATLSMGQRQLISFVRALVYNPSVLILDEATSSIDSESEALIQQAIEKLVKGRTSIVIAHRLSTIRHANKIAVFDQGELKEFGSHNELIALEGEYKKLFDMQFKKETASDTQLIQE
ncbi:MAG: ABC transporter ATP-binding protein [Chitinophagales bacterium]|nr:ABC transporter ATP-binding protein [Chitinophagales bacterium]